MADLVAHLLRRAGFDTTPDEYAAYNTLGFAAAADQLVHYDRVPDDFAQQHANDQYTRRELGKIQLLWLDRMLTTKRPLQEKMTLFWHGLFATANYKVGNPEWMWQQNELFRTHALGNFRTLLTEVAKDPAMLKWLDGDQNRKGSPNENFAREVMELFTLGIGNYTEQDVKEGARALTGWQVDRFGDVRLNPRLHDAGTKTYLGHTGNFGLDDVVDIILQQPAHATYLAHRLATFFVNDHPTQAFVGRLAGIYRQQHYELQPVVQAILTSPEFSAPESYRARIKSPIELLIGTCKKFGLKSLPPATPFLLRRMGQEPFNPPTVKGWDDGPAWISTGTILDRFNLANLLARNRAPIVSGWLAPIRALGAQGPTTATAVVTHLSDAFLHGDLDAATQQILVDYLQPVGSRDSGYPSAPLDLTPRLLDSRVRAVLHLMLTTPLHQLN